HLLGRARERIAPAAPAPVVVLVALGGGVLDVLRLVTDLEGVLTAGAHHEAVWRPGTAARDARHRITLADDVRIDGRGHEHLLAVEAPAVAAELAGPAAVGLVVAP